MQERPSFNPEQRQLEKKLPYDPRVKDAERLSEWGVIIPDKIRKGEKGVKTYFDEFVDLNERFKDLMSQRAITEDKKVNEKITNELDSISGRIGIITDLMKEGVYTVEQRLSEKNKEKVKRVFEKKALDKVE